MIWTISCPDRFHGAALAVPHPRYSVSYDLAITTAPGKGREMRTPHPMDWVPLGS